MDYDSWLEKIVEAGRAWRESDFERYRNAKTTVKPEAVSADEVAEHVQTFCHQSGELPDRIGREETGHLLWYLMGTGHQVWHDVQRADLLRARPAIESLDDLYGRLFDAHLSADDAERNSGDPIARACYMLWDMDGGLESIPMSGRPGGLVDPCFDVLEGQLRRDSPVCWLSALHGLGHIAFQQKSAANRVVRKQGERARHLVREFLDRRKDELSEDLRSYAKAAEEGAVQ